MLIAAGHRRTTRRAGRPQTPKTHAGHLPPFMRDRSTGVQLLEIVKIAKIFFGALTLIFWAWSGEVWNGFASRNPVAHPPSTDSYALHTHGAVAYLTHSESRLLFGLMAASTISLICCAIAALAENWPRKVEQDEKGRGRL
jgi:hypothetical protein